MTRARPTTTNERLPINVGRTAHLTFGGVLLGIPAVHFMGGLTGQLTFWGWGIIVLIFLGLAVFGYARGEGAGIFSGNMGLVSILLAAQSLPPLLDRPGLAAALSGGGAALILYHHAPKITLFFDGYFAHSVGAKAPPEKTFLKAARLAAWVLLLLIAVGVLLPRFVPAVTCALLAFAYWRGVRPQTIKIGWEYAQVFFTYPEITKPNVWNGGNVSERVQPVVSAGILWEIYLAVVCYPVLSWDPWRVLLYLGLVYAGMLTAIIAAFGFLALEIERCSRQVRPDPTNLTGKEVREWLRT